MISLFANPTMLTKLPYSQRNMARVTFQWVPWCLDRPANGPAYGWIHLGPFCLAWRLGPEVDEVVIWEAGRLILTRLETPAEQEAREESEAEAAFLEREANRYTEWAY